MDLSPNKLLPPQVTPDDNVGLVSSNAVDSAKIGLPELIYQAKNGKDVLLQADVTLEHVHLHCPICELNGKANGIMIRAGVKAWDFDPTRQITFPGWEPAVMLLRYPMGSGGCLNVEAFKCPWCAFKLRIADNVVLLA
jgi:hypothetical protein